MAKILRINWLPHTNASDFSKRATIEHVPASFAKLTTRSWCVNGLYSLEFRNVCRDLTTGRVWAKWTGRYFHLYRNKAGILVRDGGIHRTPFSDGPCQILQFPTSNQSRKAA